jgi:hypothetical protein
MKYLILFLSFNLFATVNYVPEVKNNTTYFLQETCEKETSQKCYPFDVKKDVEVMLVKEINVDDYSKPIYAAKTDVTPCRIYKDYIDPTTEEVQKDDCRLLVAYDEKEPTLCTDKTYYPLYAEKEKDVYEAYCTKLVAYEQKIVKQLVEDATLKAAKELKELEDAQAKAQKKAEKNEVKQAIEAAKGNINKMSQQELAAIIEKIIILLEN